MSAFRPRSVPVLAALLCLAACGCGPHARYLGRRARDLGDCFHATAGVAPLLAYGRARATDFAVAGAGFARAYRCGWRGRYEGGWGWGHHGKGSDADEIELGVPLLFNGEGDTVVGGDGVVTVLPCFTTRGYLAQPGPRARVAQRFWVGAAASLLLSVRLDFNPAELLDFLIGWGGWDLLGDDARGPQRRGSPLIQGAKKRHLHRTLRRPRPRRPSSAAPRGTRKPPSRR